VYWAQLDFCEETIFSRPYLNNGRTYGRPMIVVRRRLFVCNRCIVAKR